MSDKTKESKHWYSRYTGDYGRDTAHLTMLEHGAYVLLMDYYYSTGNPLPANADANAPALALALNERLYRICRAVTQEEKKAVDFVIDEFFELTDGYFMQARVEKELEKRREISGKRSKANEIMRENRARKKKEDDKIRANAPASAGTNAGANAQQMHSTTTTTTTKDIYKDLFEDFIKVHPKKSDIENAYKIFCKHVKDGADPQIIISSASRYADEVEGRDAQHIKSCATFLSKKTYLEPAYYIKPSKPLDTSDWLEWQITLANEIGIPAVQSWFIKAVLADKVLTVDTKFIQEWIKNNYAKQVASLSIEEIEVKNG